MQNKQVKVSELLSVCIQISLESSRIIHTIQQNGIESTQMKGINDPVTLADIQVETLIIKGLKKYWPNIKIVGEEDKIYEGELGFDLNNLNLELVQNQFFQQNQIEYLNLDDLTVWVDPLDGTRSYIEKKLDDVTTLIGISEKQRPIIGVIGLPYQKIQESYVFDPHVYFGYTRHRQMYWISQTQQNLNNQNYSKSIMPFLFKRKSVNKQKDNGEDEITLSTFTRNQEKINQIQQFNFDKIIQSTGAGKKVLDLIKGDCDASLVFNRHTSKWDIGAPEALLLCLNGQLTDLQGKEFVYQNDQEYHANKQGFLATLDKDLHQKLIQISKDFIY